MAKQKTTRRRPKSKTAPRKCFFCEEGKNPSFHESPILQRFLTERGKVIARSRNGLCGKHQKALTLQIKYARHLGLLPFVVR